MENVVSSLVLRSSDLVITGDGGIPPSSGPGIGQKNSNGTVCTWYNLDWEKLLGDNWKKYDYFHVNLSQALFSLTNIANADNRCVSFEVSGPLWINNTYSQYQRSNLSEATMGGIALNANSTTTAIFGAFSNLATMKRPESNSSITISLKQISTGYVENYAFPNYVLIFDIIPIKLQ